MDELSVKVNAKFKFLSDLIVNANARKGWIGGIVSLVGVGLLITILQLAPRTTQHFSPSASDPSGLVVTQHVNAWGDFGEVIAVLMMFVGLVSLVKWMEHRSRSGNRRKAQIKALTEALTSATGIIDSIETDVREGQRVLENIQAEIEANRELAGLTDEQSEAIAGVVRREFRRERRPSLVMQCVIALAGAGAGFLISHFL